MSGFRLLPRTVQNAKEIVRGGGGGETNYAKSRKTLLTADLHVSLVCHSGVRMKQITVSYFKMENGRLYYNDLEEIHFRNME
jgi:hypothetical protein